MRDRDLVALHWPPPLRPAFLTLLSLDDRLADIALTATQPALGAIKLAWWRDQLVALDTQPPPPEPILQAVTEELLPWRLTGASLGNLADGWAALLDEAPDPVPRGRVLFSLLGKLIGQEVEGGEVFAYADLARRTGERSWLKETPPTTRRAPPAARPITVLDQLGRRDFALGWPPEPEATAGRAWTLLKHRLTGR